MNTPMAQPNASGFEWIRGHEPEVTTVPLDDFLTVRVVQLPSVRMAVKSFLADHCPRPRGLPFVAARGKLIADFAFAAEQTLSFGELVKQARTAIKRSELNSIRGLDPRDLARVLCVAA